MSGSRNSPPTWITAAAKRVEFDKSCNLINDNDNNNNLENPSSGSGNDVGLSLLQRSSSAAAAAFISAIIVNPLDLVKTRLQAQAAEVPYQNQCGPTCFETDSMLQEWRSTVSRNGIAPNGVSTYSPERSKYTGTFDVFCKVIRQEGFSRLWRGTNASLALAVPTVGIYLPCYDLLQKYLEEFTSQHASNLTPYSPLVAGSVARTLACVTCYPIELARTRMQAFKETQAGVKPPGVMKTLLGVVSPVRNQEYVRNFQNYRLLWTGLGAQLARDVPFSAICWGTLEPIRKTILSDEHKEVSAGSIIGANFSAGFVAGSLAAAATCPLDVARTRRQIEKNPVRQMSMTIRQTLREIWRDGGMKGLFTGMGPRVARAGPSVGIVVSSYEVVKYVLQRSHLDD